MLINMLTGAHAPLIPMITSLYNEQGREQLDIHQITKKIEALLAFEAENWVTDMVTDLIIDFLAKLEDQEVSQLSLEMALHDGLPLRLCLYLMDRNDAIAETFIEKSDKLDAMDLIYRVKSGQVREMLAIARRDNLPPEVLTALIESNKSAVYVALLKNPSISVQKDIIRHLKEQAQRSPSVAWYVVTKQLDRQRAA